jgi:hypothetical protein
MKTFIYKSLIISFLSIIVFKFTISSIIHGYEKKFYENFTKEKVEFYKSKIRDEMRNAIKKESYLQKDDAILIKQFIDKVKSELSSSNSN